MYIFLLSHQLSGQDSGFTAFDLSPSVLLLRQAMQAPPHPRLAFVFIGAQVAMSHKSNKTNIFNRWRAMDTLAMKCRLVSMYLAPSEADFFGQILGRRGKSISII